MLDASLAVSVNRGYSDIVALKGQLPQIADQPLCVSAKLRSASVTVYHVGYKCCLLQLFP